MNDEKLQAMLEDALFEQQEQQQAEDLEKRMQAMERKIQSNSNSPAAKRMPDTAEAAASPVPPMRKQQSNHVSNETEKEEPNRRISQGMDPLLPTTASPPPTNNRAAMPQPGAFPVTPTPAANRSNPAVEEQPVIQGSSGDGLTTSNDNDQQEEPGMICAKVVPDEQLEAEFRQRIIEEAVQAQVHTDLEHQAPQHVHHAPSQENNHHKNRLKLVLCGVSIAILLILILAIALGISLGKDDKTSTTDANTTTPIIHDDNNSTSHLSTLELVTQKDYVTCGAYLPSPGLVAWNNDTQQMEGLLADMCRAIAMVALGDPNKVQFTSVGPFDRFPLLHERQIDVVTEPATHTMERDVRESNIFTGLSFSAPFYYSGLGFAGQQPYIDCMDRFDVSTGTCRDVKLCVTAGTTHLEIVRQHVPAALAIVQDSAEECIQHFIQGHANVISGEPISLNERRFQEAGYQEPIYFTHNVLSREPLAMVTLDKDTEWSDLVNSVMDILYLAEAWNLTQQDATTALQSGQLPAHMAIGDSSNDSVLTNRILNVVAVAGHYGQLYQQNLQDQLPRGGLNQLNANHKDAAATGLLYSFPFGYNLDRLDPAIEPGPKIEAIQKRGTLRCGVRERDGFAELQVVNETSSWYGLDIEMCKALAAALFRTEEGTLEIQSMGSASDGFQALADSSIDVLAGAPLTLTNKYHQADTGLSFKFSVPYFYGEQEILALATNREDTKFGDMLYWLVMALVHAEEEQITSSNPTLMPTINLFGDSLKQIFIDCVSRQGNYGDLYRRTLEPSIPRAGRNLLNDLEAGLGPQQVAIPFL